MSSAFHAQTDDQSEVVNRVIVMYLRCLVGDRPKSWLQWLPWAEFCYNTSYQTAVKCSPFHIVYGRDPPTLCSYQQGTDRVATVHKQLIARDEFMEDIKNRLLQAQVTMQSTHDKHRRSVHYEVGDWVG
ncbi:hypothetical protein GUJ93_ZPchr0015g6641 [Zizania palustris]|uniref:Integrase catalytic domain-containing protein n=1 Tax=Zizania palustris TaxID=103762 RepID=A0A8J5TB31_ZIZPA|nr:hypothetical protein GUJ93_ZPchr0015g6641 [Zizania palustris]